MGCTPQLIVTAFVEQWCTMVCTSCFSPTVSLTLPPPNPTSPSHLDLCFSAIVHSLKCLTQIVDEHTKQDQADKEPKGFKKLEPFTQSMILFASEPLANDVDTDCTQPVNSYAHLLQLRNVAQAKIHLDHALQVVHSVLSTFPTPR
jgi:hypothetical protein